MGEYGPHLPSYKLDKHISKRKYKKTIIIATVKQLRAYQLLISSEPGHKHENNITRANMIAVVTFVTFR